MPSQLTTDIRKKLSVLVNARPRSFTTIDKTSKDLIKLCDVSNDSCWPEVYPFLYRMQSVLGEKYRAEFFEQIARHKPVDFTIYILSPYIYEAVNTRNYVCSNRKLITSSVTVAMKKSCESSEKEELIGELEHLVAHYARKLFGEDIANDIAEGVTNALSEPDVTFDDVTKIRQAYWNKQQCTKIQLHRVHRTVRVNGLPFAEGVFVYLMARFASEYGINLKIESIPWQEVGTALLTNRIDVAIHNTSIGEKQLLGLRHLADNRILYRSGEKAFRYEGYYILGRQVIPRTKSEIYKKITGEAGSRVAVVQNSDHEKVFEDWWDKGPRAKRNKKSAQDVWLPVCTPDAAVEAVVDRKVDYCLVGGIHKTYVLDAFKSVFKNEKTHCLELNDHMDIDLFFWSVSSRKTESSILLNDLVTLWREVESRWSSVKYSKDKNMEELRKSCVVYVNGQPNKAFVKREFKDHLQKLIDVHDKLNKPIVGKVVSVDVEGW